jgi:hypothetical protein
MGPTVSATFKTHECLELFNVVLTLFCDSLGLGRSCILECINGRVLHWDPCEACDDGSRMAMIVWDTIVVPGT